MKIKKYIPRKYLLLLKLLIRYVIDFKNGHRKRFAKEYSETSALTFFLETKQAIRQNASSENKIHNLKIAAKKIEKIVIYPNEIFSFWHIIGNPSKKNGYKKGRNLIATKIKEDYGGGLCQLSGIIYHTCLKAGLEILERHNHSIDIYEEVERFTPLGADATIVFGYKDLRIKNNFQQPIAFQFLITSTDLICKLNSPVKLPEYELFFTREEIKSGVIVHTKRKKESGTEVIQRSEYKIQ